MERDPLSFWLRLGGEGGVNAWYRTERSEDDKKIVKKIVLFGFFLVVGD